MDNSERNRGLRLRNRWFNVAGLCAVVTFVMHAVKSATNRSAFDIVAVAALIVMIGSIAMAAAMNRRART